MTTALLQPKSYARENMLSNLESSMGSWSGLDESGADKVGVGIFIKIGDTGAAVVSSVVPGSSAHLSGLISAGDKITGIDNEVVAGSSQLALRKKIHGLPGTYVTLDVERKVCMRVCMCLSTTLCPCPVGRQLYLPMRVCERRL